MRFGLLGSLEVVGDDGEPVDLGGAQPRAVLAMLLVASGQVVPADSLIDAIWGDFPPASAGGTLQSYVSRLRRVLEPGRSPREAPRVLLSDPPGYRLDVVADSVDFRRFERLVAEGRALLDGGDVAAARDRLAEATALWRGPALVEFADQEFARGVAARLEERRLVAIEERLDADLRLGRHAAVVGELAELVERHPLREGLRAHLAVALYRAGRQAEALRALDDARRTLRDELGIDPGRALRDLEARILDHDPSLDVEAPTAPAMVASPPTAAAPTTLVGRTAELAQLTAALDDARTGRTRWALVEGEPGIGKTRLLEEVATQATHRGARTVWGRCYEGGAAPSFWPWLGILRGLVDALPDADREARLRTGLGQLLNAGGASAVDPAAGPDPAPDPARYQVFEAVADVLTAVAARQPVVTLFDDLQWADQASLELIEFLAQRLRDTPVLLAGSLRVLEMGRNDAVVAAVAAVQRQSGSRRLRLTGMGEPETAALIEQATGTTAPADTVHAIHQRAEGNPFFVGELARLLAAGPAGPGNFDVPAGVRDVVRRRLSLLPEATTELLTVAAIIGRDVELRLLTRASGLSVDRCLDDLEPALVNRLLEPVPDQPSTFRFAHALVREVVLDDVTPLRRARFHQRVAEAIVAVRGADDDETAEIVAEHLWAAVPLGLERQAAAALERGADVAIRRFAYEAAGSMLERAVQLRRAAGSGPDDMEAELLAISRVAAVRRMRHGYAMGGQPLPVERVKELAHRTGRIDIFFSLLWTNWAASATACDFRVARPLAAELLELGRTSDDAVIQALGYSSWGVQQWHAGDMVEAAAYLDQALSVGGDAGLAALLESGPLVRSFHLHFHMLLDDFEDGWERVDRLVEEQHAPFDRLVVSVMCAFTATLNGDPVRAGRLAAAAASADPDESLSFFGGSSQMFLGWSMALSGEPEEGAALIARGRDRYLASGARAIMPFYEAMHADALVSAGRPDEARAAIDRAHDMMATYGESWYRPLVLAAEARVEAAAGKDPAPVLARAREAAAQGGIPLLIRRTEELSLD